MQLNGHRRIVFYSKCSKCPPFACTHARRRLRHSSIALSMMHLLQTLFQFVIVVHPRLVHSLLDDAPDPVINRIKVRAVRWPKICWNASVARESHIVGCRCSGALSC